MKLLICERSELFAHEVSNWCRTKASAGQARSMFIPAGQTPIPVYQAWTEGQPEFLKHIDLLQIDDVVSGEARGMFRKFLFAHLPRHLARIRQIDEADDIADLAVLGLGLNGHVAFHEPGLPPDFLSGCVRLENQTCDNLRIPHGSWGVSYGVGAFLKSKSILMMVRGHSKKEVLKRLINGDPSLPATTLLAHSDLTIIADAEACDESLMR